MRSTPVTDNDGFCRLSCSASKCDLFTKCLFKKSRFQSCVQGEGVGGMSPHLDHLRPGGEEVQDPGTQGCSVPVPAASQQVWWGLRCWKLNWNHWTASSHSPHFWLSRWESGVQNLGDRIICGSVWTVCELQRVHGAREEGADVVLDQPLEAFHDYRGEGHQ